MNNLPYNWDVIPLADILLSLESGSRPKGGVRGSVSGIPSIGGEHLSDNGGFRFQNIKYVPKEFAESMNRGHILKNDILVVKDGATTGKVSYVDNSFPFDKSVVNEHVFICRPVRNFNPRFLFFFLFSSEGNKRILVNFQGTAQGGINLSFAPNTLIPIAPLAEQHRIVAKIEELFSDLDAGIASLKTAQAQLKIYRQAVLKWAFEGKLTAEWRKEKKQKGELKSADELLVQIKTEREKRHKEQVKEWEAAVNAWEAGGKAGKKPTKPKTLKEVEPLSQEAIAELPELPDGWGWVKLGRIASDIRIGPFGSLLHKSDYVSGQIPIVNPSHIKHGKIVPDSTLTITVEKFKELCNYALYRDDIVFGRRGEMGRCAVVRERENGYLCGTGSLLIRLVHDLNSDFYCFVLRSHTAKNYLENASIGTTMRNLNEDILNNIPVQLCQLAEQLEIVQEIESRLSICDSLEATITENLQRSEALRQSILKRAFEGKLVPQDPNDEPAETLLERIKQEKYSPKNPKQLEFPPKNTAHTRAKKNGQEIHP